ncbi:hypothetical protein SASPL_149135 [Salvia splendens]|uniref:Uncharacterized protein n=1 Tax=Salvia splendens TaxID=180675 RepID=A0A8X8WC88_SALSN|nr:hypothetical protein SASPL_149135 [Salvia splendens]
MGEFGSSCFWLWRRSRRRVEDQKQSEKSCGIATYYGDYGMEENMYGEEGFFPIKEHERVVKEAMEERENAVLKMGKKGFTFGLKRRQKY